MKIFEGNIVDVVSRRIFAGKVLVADKKIVEIKECETQNSNFILPGFIDSHIHIESSMATPQRFAEIALGFGVVAVVTDPHEICNVLGVDGFNFMLDDAKNSPLKFFFCVPSCVPSTSFETSGAVLNSEIVAELLKNDRVVALAEMMNYTGVLNKDKEILAKIEASKQLGKPIDGHAPGLSEYQNRDYINAGISTDHECNNVEEALAKIKYGMKIQIREGSASKNMIDLAPLYSQFPDSLMLCSDDLHADDLMNGYMPNRIKTLKNLGCDLFDVLRSLTLNPVKHYNLNVGLLQEGDNADFIVVDNLENFDVLETVIDGETVVKNGQNLFYVKQSPIVNNFNCSKITVSDIQISASDNLFNVIQVIDKSLLTERFETKMPSFNGKLELVADKDILKIVCLNRYSNKSKPSVALINGFGIKKGAFASCIAHDSHNIICVGADDESIVKVINKIIENRGGLSVTDGVDVWDLKLEIGGIMSSSPTRIVGTKYQELQEKIKQLGCKLTAPFMTLAFMALPVIPKLKITDKGLFDVEKFDFVN